VDKVAHESEKLFQEGLEMYKKQLYGEALKRWKAVSTINPNYHNIGMYINVCQRQEVQTLTSIESVDMPEEDLGGVILVDSVVESKIEFENYICQKNFAEAEHCLELLLKERPSDPVAMVFLVKGFLKVKNGLRMKECARKLVNLQPYLAHSHYIYGSALFQLQQFRQAQDALAKALRLRPNNFRILYYMGMTQLALRDPLKAEDFFSRAKLINPNNKSVINAMNQLVAQKQDLEKSIKEASEIMESQPKYPDILFKVANTYVRSHCLEKAFDCLEKALEINQDYKEALYLRGKLEIEIGQYDKALKSLSRILNSMDKMPFGYDNVIQFEKVGYIEEAACELLRILKLEPDFGAIHIELGKTYVNSSQFARALEELEKGLALSPQYPDGHYYRGLCLRENGDLDEAIDCFATALELSPSYFDAGFVMAELLLKQLRTKEALKILKRCVTLLQPNTDEFQRFQNMIQSIENSQNK
tara:strand:+ start:202 stop:1623 length:1422 start_codon:yes stop_codon:yes gene_type:complete